MVQAGSPTSYLISDNRDRAGPPPTQKQPPTPSPRAISAYVSFSEEPGRACGARISLEATTSADGAGTAEAMIVTGLIGALAGALIGIIVSLAIGRNDKRLRERDEIANSIGVPVLASVPVAHPSDAADWAKLLRITSRDPCTPGGCGRPCSSSTGSDDVLTERRQ